MHQREKIGDDMPKKGETREETSEFQIQGQVREELFEHYFAEGWAAPKCVAWLENTHNVKISVRCLNLFLLKEKKLRQEVCKSILKDRLEVSIGPELERMAAEMEYWRNEGVVKHSKFSAEEKTRAWPTVWKAINQHNQLRLIFFRATTGLVQNKEFDLDEFAEAVKEKILKSDKE